MTFFYRVVPLAGEWPGTRNKQPKHARFETSWSGTLEQLRYELARLEARDVVLKVETSAHTLRNDGQMRADARVQSPGVVLEFTSGAERLSFPCDTYRFWQDNVRAIALTLEALRAVDRYGTQRGRQYVGFKALPGAGQSTTTMSVQEAVQLLCLFRPEGSAPNEQQVLRDPRAAQDCVRQAMSRSHPDSGGSAAAFQRVNEAKGVLYRHHGLK